MSDLDFFRGLTKLFPLEPITDAETYYKACDLEEEYREAKDPATLLFLKALGVFVTAYETGYRPDEQEHQS